MSYVILDLEWNGTYSRHIRKFVNEIIEFGAIKTDDNFNEIDRFSVLIKPQIGKKLCNKVAQLTKITNEELYASGVTFLNAVSKFAKFSGDSILLTWGTSDILALIENYSYYIHDIHLPFLSAYCNIQEYCERCLNMYDESAQLGLTACAEMLNIDFSEDEQHRAFADARLSLECLKHFIGECSIQPFISDAKSQSFYDRIMFKNYFITDIRSRHIDKKEMYFVCDNCGAKARRESEWKLKNKSFCAEFFCESCEKRFLGRISFKRRYDGITVKKKIYNIKSETDEDGEEENPEVLPHNL